MICLNCRKGIPEGRTYCEDCGTPVAVSKAQALPKAWKKGSWKVSLPEGRVGKPDAADETLMSWAKESLRETVRTLPKRLKSIAVFAGVVLAVNLLFWWILKPNFLPGPFSKLVSLVVFLTATYNDVVPKTIFWVITFTFGKRLFFKVRREGAGKAFKELGNVVPQLKQAMGLLGHRAWGLLLLLGGGFGLMLANNFASYSRFSEARNKFDKYFVVFVMAFAISYVLGEAKRTGIFKFVKLLNSDVCRALKRPNTLPDEGVYLILSGFVAGLLLDAPLIIVKWMYGGYILGAVAIAAAVVLGLQKPRKVTG